MYGVLLILNCRLYAVCLCSYSYISPTVFQHRLLDLFHKHSNWKPNQHLPDTKLKECYFFVSEMAGRNGDMF